MSRYPFDEMKFALGINYRGGNFRLKFYEQETEVLKVDELKERDEWRAAIKAAYIDGKYRRMIRLLAANVGDAGDVWKFIDNFTENASPSAGWRAS